MIETGIIIMYNKQVYQRMNLCSQLKEVQLDSGVIIIYHNQLYQWNKFNQDQCQLYMFTQSDNYDIVIDLHYQIFQFTQQMESDEQFQIFQLTQEQIHSIIDPGSALDHHNQLEKIQSIQATCSTKFKEKPANHLTYIFPHSLPCIAFFTPFDGECCLLKLSYNLLQLSYKRWTKMMDNCNNNDVTLIQQEFKLSYKRQKKMMDNYNNNDVTLIQRARKRNSIKKAAICSLYQQPAIHLLYHQPRRRMSNIERPRRMTSNKKAATLSLYEQPPQIRMNNINNVVIFHHVTGLNWSNYIQLLYDSPHRKTNTNVWYRFYIYVNNEAHTAMTSLQKNYVALHLTCKC